jgi:hypothetical protein
MTKQEESSQELTGILKKYVRKSIAPPGGSNTSVVRQVILSFLLFPTSAAGNGMVLFKP